MSEGDPPDAEDPADAEQARAAPGLDVTERLPPALEDLFRDGRLNAIVAWAMVGVLALVLVESLLTLDLEWIGFVATAGTVVLVPPVAHRDWRVTVPWEVLGLALLPILVRGLLGGEVGTFATFLAVAALALVITVELHMFTELTLTHWFAVLLVALTTMAAGAVHAMARWALDRLAGTSYLVPEDVPAGTEAAQAAANESLMTEFLWITAAGIAAGLLFDAYFRRRDRQLRRAIGRVVPGRGFRRRSGGDGA